MTTPAPTPPSADERAKLIAWLRGIYPIDLAGVNPPEFVHRQLPSSPISLEAAAMLEADAELQAQLSEMTMRWKASQKHVLELEESEGCAP